MSETWEETKARLAKRGIKPHQIEQDDVLIPDMMTSVPVPRYGMPVEKPQAKPIRMAEKRSILPLYEVVSTLDGVRKVVAWNVPINEAEIIQRAAHKRIMKVHSLVELEKIDFAITIVEIKKI